jgi:hypothetical protein
VSTIGRLNWYKHRSQFPAAVHETSSSVGNISDNMTSYTYKGPVDTSVQPDLSKLKGKSAIVTGGTSGIAPSFWPILKCNRCNRNWKGICRSINQGWVWAPLSANADKTNPIMLSSRLTASFIASLSLLATSTKRKAKRLLKMLRSMG